MPILPRNARRPLFASTFSRRLMLAAFALTIAILALPMAWTQNVVSGSVTLQAGIAVVAGGGSTTPTGAPFTPAAGSLGALLRNPHGVAVDKSGNLYIADTTNNVVEQVSPAGSIVVVAGGGSTAPATATTPTGASLSGPTGVALDGSGNIYIADTGHSLVEEVTAPGSPSATFAVVAGNGCTHTCTAPGTTQHSATSVALSGPTGVAVDGSGNIYIADAGHYEVEEVTAGELKVVAGGGEYTPSTTGRTATNVTLANPYGVAVDASGDLYIADAGTVPIYETTHNYIEEVTSGSLKVVAGSGCDLECFTVPTTSPQTATSVALSNPYSVAVDASGNIYIADGGHNEVEEISAGEIVIVAGGASTEPSTTPQIATSVALNDPYGVAVDASGNIYVADEGHDLVEKAGVNTTLPTTAVASTSASFNVFVKVAHEVTIAASTTADGTPEFTVGTPTHTGVGGAYTYTVPITFSPEYPGLRTGKLTFTYERSTLGTVGLYGTGTGPLGVQTPGALSIVAGTGTTSAATAGTATNARLGPYSSTVDAAGNFYIVDRTNNEIDQVNPAGNITVVAGGSGGTPPTTPGPATSASLSSPEGVAVDAAGNLYIADTGNGLVEQVSATTGYIAVVAGETSGGTVPTTTPSAATSAALHPTGVAVDGLGNLYIADGGNNRVEQVSAVTGQIVVVAGDGGTLPTTPGPATSASLSSPEGVAVDAAGNLYIADTGNLLVEEVTAPGTSGAQIVAVAGGGNAAPTTIPSSATSAQLSNPTGVTVDGAGDIYIADSGNNLVEQVNAGQIIAVVAGSGTTTPPTTAAQFATAVTLNAPTGVAVDGAGSLYIADSGNSVVEKDVTSLPSTLSVSFPNTDVGSASPQEIGTFENIGNETLTVTGLAPALGVNFNLSGAATTCTSSTSLTAGANCALGFVFQPTVTGPLTDDFVITDSNLNGSTTPANAVQQVNLTGTAYDTLTAAPVILTVAYNSTGNVVPLTLAGDVTSVAVVSAPTNGTATASGTGITYTPFTGYSGPDSFTYAETNPGGTSSAGTVTVTVTPQTPIAANSSATVAFDSTANPIPLSLTGGAATLVAVTAGPTNGTVAISGATITYTPTTGYSGLDSFTYTATNTGGTSSPATVTITVSAAPVQPPVAANSTATVTYDSTNNPIPLSLSGGTPTSVAITTPATNGTVTANGIAISYTPNSGYSGTDTFAYTATNLGGTSAPATVTITVSPAPVLDFSLSLGAGGGSATVSPGGTASYTLNVAPTNGAFPGTVSFAVTGLPTGATYTFSPSTLSANGGGGAVTLSVIVPTTVAAVKPGHDFGSKALPVAFGLLLLPLAGMRRFRKTGRKLSGYVCLWLLLVLGTGMVAGMSGCGGGNNNNSTTPAAQTYDLTVTVTSASVQHSTTLTLIVE